MGSLILSALLSLSFVRMFIERHAVRVEIGSAVPKFRFAVWGHIGVGTRYESPFLIVALPFWSFEPSFIRDEYVWVQDALLWKRTSGWHFIHLYT